MIKNLIIQLYILLKYVVFYCLSQSYILRIIRFHTVDHIVHLKLPTILLLIKYTKMNKSSFNYIFLLEN